MGISDSFLHHGKVSAKEGQLQIDYLDSRGEHEARSEVSAMTESAPANPESESKGKGRAVKPGAMVTGKACANDDVPF